MRFTSNSWTKRLHSASWPQVLGKGGEQIRAVLNGKGSDNHAAGRMAVSTFAIRIGGAALAYLSQIVFARALGAHDYGIYSVAWTLVIILGVMSCGGFSASANRFLPQYRQAGDLDGLRGFLFASRVSAFLIGAATAILGIGIVFLVSPIIEPYYVQPIAIVLLALPFFAFGLVQDGIARSYDWSSLSMLPTYIWRPLTILILLFVAIFAGLKADALTMATVAICAAMLIALYQYLQLSRRLAHQVPIGPRRIELKNWILISLPMLMVDGFLQLITSADVIMVSFFQDPDEVAIYFAASRTLALVHFVYFAVRAASAHRFSDYMHRQDQKGLEDYVRKATHWTFWPSLLAGAGLLLIAPLLLALFGSGYESGYQLIAILMIGVLARASVGPADALLTMTGHQKNCAGIYAVTFLLNVLLNLAFIPLLGLAGAAIATSCAILFEASALALVAKRKLNITTFVLLLLFPPKDRQVDQ
ncbi:Polysaccharide biosynthesis protein [Labrenzia sp. THAF82]|uniref:lipopolysaccharide biosynthesis protein n=1 Tax=Labrenzia sp. THAF82 TaxID=2587861 RepID=UPI0012AAB9E4|nr:oligosaccharide flippase family protein [Labrenzia sp. THAF82]QFT29696.1 Polysaccharide biosynthesis protein [Labrenzia sp. THAF82]